MSHKAVEDIISRAVVDLEFRELLFSNPDQAIAGATLTDDEKTALQNMSREKFDASLGQLEELTVSGGALAQPTAGTPQAANPSARFDWTKIGYAPSNTN
jgi:hypothetical protein